MQTCTALYKCNNDVKPHLKKKKMSWSFIFTFLNLGQGTSLDIGGSWETGNVISHVYQAKQGSLLHYVSHHYKAALLLSVIMCYKIGSKWAVNTVCDYCKVWVNRFSFTESLQAHKTCKLSRGHVKFLLCNICLPSTYHITEVHKLLLSYNNCWPFCLIFIGVV